MGLYNIRGDVIGEYTIDPRDESFWSLLEAPALLNVVIDNIDQSPNALVASLRAKPI
jgi:hypothetical protein